LQFTSDPHETFSQVALSKKVVRLNTGIYWYSSILIICVMFCNVCSPIIQHLINPNDGSIAVMIFLCTVLPLICVLLRRKKLEHQLKSEIVEHGYFIQPQYVQSSIGHTPHSLADTYVCVTYKFQLEKAKSKRYIFDTYFIGMHPNYINQFEAYLKSAQDVHILFLRKTKYALKIDFKYSLIDRN